MGEGRRAGDTTAMAGEAVGTTNAATMEDTTIAREIRHGVLLLLTAIMMCVSSM